MKARKSIATAAAVLVAGLVGSSVLGGSQAWAFDRSWVLHSCAGVAAGERQLTDGAPTAVDGGEAGYIRIATNDAGNEECVFRTNQVSFSTSQFPFTKVVAAVSNGTRLRVEFRTDAGGCGGTLLQTVTLQRAQSETSSTMASVASASPVQLPAGQVVRAVCVRVDDHTDGTNSGAAALIDRIAAKPTATGQESIIEGFGGSSTTTQ
jgi:hypothetical protein